MLAHCILRLEIVHLKRNKIIQLMTMIMFKAFSKYIQENYRDFTFFRETFFTALANHAKNKKRTKK